MSNNNSNKQIKSRTRVSDHGEVFTHEREVNAMLDLKKYGWLTVGLDPDDSRIRLYRLKEPNDAVKEMEE